MLTPMIKSLEEGIPFAESLQNSGRFKKTDCKTIMAGEETGALAEVLTQLSNLYYQESRIRKTITEASAYPLLVLSTSVIALFIMSAFVTPMFASIFSQSGQTLPGLTVLLLSISEVLPKTIFIISFAGILTGILIRYRNRFPVLASTMSAQTLRIPFYGIWIRNLTLHRISRNLSIMLESGMTLVESFTLMEDAGLPLAYQRAIDSARTTIVEGAKIQDSFDAKLFDPIFIQLTRAGEDSGELRRSMRLLADHYEEDLQHLAKNLKNILEPTLIIFTGCIVGLIVLGFYLPIFELNTGFTG